MRGVVVVMTVVGCSSPSPAKIDAAPPNPDAHVFHDAAIDAPPDAPLGPCTLTSLSLAAATLAGCGEPGTMNGVRDLVRFDNPVNVALDASGVAYVPDFDSGRLRRVDTTGDTSTLVNMPQFRRPFGIVMTPGGFMYVETDDDNTMHHGPNTGTLWKVTPAGVATVVLADHQRPRGLALLTDGRVATADYLHHVVEIIDPVTAIPQPLAGTLDVAGHANLTGAAATFAQPWDLVLNTNGDLVVTDYDNNCLRLVTLAGVVTDFAGTGVPGHQDGPVATAQFSHPKGIAMDASGALYVTEAGNHDIRKIAGGQVTTIAGMVTVNGGFADNADPLQAQFQGVEGLDVSADGHRVVIADGNNGDGTAFNRVRVVTLP